MNLAKWVAVLAIAVVAVFLLMPQEKLDGMKESWLRVKNDPGQACLDFERRGLKDPDSARLLSTSEGERSVVMITYKAKNSYGAFDKSEAACSTDPDGKVSEEHTKLVRMRIRLTAEIKLSEARIECHDKIIKLQKENMALAEARKLAGCDWASPHDSQD